MELTHRVLSGLVVWPLVLAWESGASANWMLQCSNPGLCEAYKCISNPANASSVCREACGMMASPTGVSTSTCSSPVDGSLEPHESGEAALKRAAPNWIGGEPVNGLCGAGSPLWAAIDGEQRDLLELVAGSRWLSRVRLKDGKYWKCDQDVVVGDRIVGLRHGEDNDLLHGWGLTLSGDLREISFRPGAGRDHIIKIDPADGHAVLFTWGELNDLGTKFCFNPTSGNWTRSPGTGKGHGWGGRNCTEPVIYPPPAEPTHRPNGHHHSKKATSEGEAAAGVSK
jgi:hypothetical protein